MRFSECIYYTGEVVGKRGGLNEGHTSDYR